MRIVLVGALVLSGLSVACGRDAPNAPTPLALTAVTPQSAVAGDWTPVMVQGVGFQPGATVTIGGAPVVVTVPTTTRIYGQIASEMRGTFDVIVTNPDGQNARLAGAFSFVTGAPLLVTSISPASGIPGGGEWFDVHGTFRPNTSITIGGVRATMIAAERSSLFVLTPPHAPGVADVTISGSDGQSVTLPDAFTYTAPWPGDFTGVWMGAAGIDSEVPLRFSVEQGRLTGVTCTTVANHGPIGHTFVAPPLVTNVFSIADAGIEMTGSLISATKAGGTLKWAVCGNTTLGWRAERE